MSEKRVIFVLQNDIIMKKTLITLFLALGSILPMSAQHGKIVDDGWLKENYTKREVMVTVRDGRKIYNAIYEPKREYLPWRMAGCSHWRRRNIG